MLHTTINDEWVAQMFSSGYGVPGLGQTLMKHDMAILVSWNVLWLSSLAGSGDNAGSDVRNSKFYLGGQNCAGPKTSWFWMIVKAFYQLCILSCKNAFIFWTKKLNFLSCCECDGTDTQQRTEIVVSRRIADPYQDGKRHFEDAWTRNVRCLHGTLSLISFMKILSFSILLVEF